MVDSPCIRLCSLDRQDICVGCGRTIHEIVAWNRVDDDERRRIVENSRQRRINLEQARPPR